MNEIQPHVRIIKSRSGMRNSKAVKNNQIITRNVKPLQLEKSINNRINPFPQPALVVEAAAFVAILTLCALLPTMASLENAESIGPSCLENFPAMV